MKRLFCLKAKNGLIMKARNGLIIICRRFTASLSNDAGETEYS